MKQLLFIITFITVSLVCLSAENEKDIKAALKHVTVFTDRAQLSHEASVELIAGKTILKLGSLSPYIDAQSIQVKGFGDFVILSVNHQNNYLSNLEDIPEVKSIRSQIEVLQLKVEDEKAAIAVLKEKEAFLIANRAILVKETTFSIEQFKNVIELYTNNMDQVTTSILKKNRLIKDYEKQIAALQQQISDRFGRKNLPSGEISVSVSAEKPLTAKISYSYVVSNAGWFPSYDIRVDNIARPVSIVYKANVFQNTGVSWKDVRLSFSNATPWISGNVPNLDPWFIDYYMPAPPVPVTRGAAYRQEKKSSEDAVEMLTMEAPAEVNEIEAMPVMVERQTGETTFTFDVSVPYSINPDGKIQTIEIQRTSSPAEYRYVTIPKLSSTAYLTGNITDWAKQGLIGGEATLYFDNAYVGKSFLDTNQLKDTLMVSLGADNSILVKREKRQDFTSKRVLGANKTETYSFTITVRNNKSNPVRITVSDQIPISSNSGIEVEAIELSAGRFNRQTGEIKWDLEIKPQESRELVLTYSVKYPKDRTVILE
ncbi:MAG: DUF4139 domain-containing protein [Bacteroidales bacterium]|nr:DUF4139 domain-containing protein [Bacteroidales bacterium]